MNTNEVLKLALEAAYLAGWNASGEGYNAEYPFGDHARNPEEDAAWVKDRDNAICQALANKALDKMAENARELGLDYEPARLPFGVGGGLVAIKTLLSRDPCVHAHTAIQMIDAILAEQPAQQEPVATLFGSLPVYDKPAQQEPVAWICEGSEHDEKHSIDYWPGDVDDLPIGTKLYTSPPVQRTWVGLTDEEIFEIHKQVDSMQYLTFGHAIEAKLKEKNNG